MTKNSIFLFQPVLYLLLLEPPLCRLCQSSPPDVSWWAAVGEPQHYNQAGDWDRLKWDRAWKKTWGEGQLSGAALLLGWEGLQNGSLCDPGTKGLDEVKVNQKNAHWTQFGAGIAHWSVVHLSSRSSSLLLEAQQPPKEVFFLTLLSITS